MRPLAKRIGYALACAVTAVMLAALPGLAQTPPVRDVTPPGVTRVYRSAETAELSTAQRRLVAVHVLNDGVFQSDGKLYALYGVNFPARKKICISATGTRWACGQRAYLMLRSLLEDRSPECQPHDAATASDEKAPMLATCRIDGTDIALALLRSGVAELADGVVDKRYMEAAAAAKIQNNK
ncbi:MAG TPA: thermonuclease family protein [Pseudolabrys sp.]|nr:thermonuclease family protein [Pseudolabrys sp.]